MNALAILRAARAYATDPDHIVKDPFHIYEDAAGNDAFGEEAVRGCLLGCAFIATRCEGDAASAAYNAIEVHLINGDYQDTMRAGHATILATYDKAIADLEAQVVA